MTSPTSSAPSWSRPASRWPSPTTQFGPAIQRVYSTDPQSFEWHIYTEGWGRSSQRYDVGGVNSFNAPWLGNMPGWLEQGFWQYENEQLDELGQTLFRGEFDSLEERNEIYRQMTEIGLDESIRVWLATVNNSFPVRSELEGVTPDLVAGPRNIWTLREAYVPGNDDVRVGHQWVWTDRTTYNPVGGYGDVYSTDLARNLTDPSILNDPFTGIPQPFRASYEVETAGPEGQLEVPADALGVGPRRRRVGAGPGRYDGREQGHLRLLRLHRTGLAPRPAHHPRGCGLLHRPDVRPGLRRGEGAESRPRSRPRSDPSSRRSRATA